MKIPVNTTLWTLREIQDYINRAYDILNKTDADGRLSQGEKIEARGILARTKNRVDGLLEDIEDLTSLDY